VQITDIAGVLIRRVTGRLVRRATAAVICLLFALAALYHLTIAAELALDEHIGVLQTRLAVGGFYALAAIIIAVVLFATRAKLAAARNSGLSSSSRDLQIAMIVESILLGLALARGVSPRKPTTPPGEDSQASS
jgi:hypothetical protein